MELPKPSPRDTGEELTENDITHEGDSVEEVTRERVIRVASALFTRRGVADVSVAEVARITGVSRAEFSSLFPTHDVLVLAWLASWERAWLLELMAGDPATDRRAEVLDTISARLNAGGSTALPFSRVLLEVGPDTPVGQACRCHLAGLRALAASITAEVTQTRTGQPG